MVVQSDEIELEHVRHALESRRQLRQATMNFEHAVLRALFLLNGGGLIAFLTFLGTGNAKGLETKCTTQVSLLLWLVGLVCAGIATGFGYRSQFKFYKAHGEFQRVQVDLREYPPDDRSKDEILKEGHDQTEKAKDQRKWMHRFSVASIVAFGIGALASIMGYVG